MTKRILAALLALAMALSLCSFEVFAADMEVVYDSDEVSFGPDTWKGFDSYLDSAELAKLLEAVNKDGAELTVSFNAAEDGGMLKIVFNGAYEDNDKCLVKGIAKSGDYEATAVVSEKCADKVTSLLNNSSGKIVITRIVVKAPASSASTAVASGKVTLDGNDSGWAEYPFKDTAALADLNKALTEYAGQPGYMVVLTSKVDISVGMNTSAEGWDWAQPDAATTIKFSTETYREGKLCISSTAKNVEVSWEIIKEECKHENLTYVVNEDGTHSAICKNCLLYVKSEYKQAHTFKDGKCSFCGTPEVEDPDKVELGVQVYVQETVVAWAGAYKGLKTGKEVEFELTNEAALAEMADIVAKPEVTKNYTQAPVFALQVSIDNCDYNTKEVDGKYPTVNFAFHYGDITIKAKGFEDVVIPSDSVDVELTAKYESWGGYSGTSTTIDLYSAVMKLKDMTLEKFCKEYLPAITSITCDLEYDSLTCHHDVKTYKSNKDKATHTVTCAFCGEVIDAAEAHDGDPCSKCDYTAAEKDSKKKTNYPGYVVQLGEEYHGFFMGGFMITMPHTFVGDECTQCGYIRPAAVEEAPAESAE